MNSCLLYADPLNQGVSMQIAISSDEYSPLIDFLIKEIEQRGHKAHYFGPKENEKAVDWPVITLQAVDEVKQGIADEAIVLCWTGTGCSLIANKVPGIRAALCVDAETAKGARIWNHANVLALSLRYTSAPILKEILTAWFESLKLPIAPMSGIFCKWSESNRLKIILVPFQDELLEIQWQLKQTLRSYR